jgi:hypothetical protein
VAANFAMLDLEEKEHKAQAPAPHDIEVRAAA